MKEITVLHHVALQYNDRKKAKLFFTKILGLNLKKTFNLSKELSNEIFGIKEKVIVDVYANDNSYFEIFITNRKTKYNFEHISIEIENIEEFIKRCERFEIKPIFVKKSEKTLLFIKDYVSNYLKLKKKRIKKHFRFNVYSIYLFSFDLILYQ